MQDGIPPHFAIVVHEWLNDHFPGRWIGHHGHKIAQPEILTDHAVTFSLAFVILPKNEKTHNPVQSHSTPYH